MSATATPETSRSRPAVDLRATAIDAVVVLVWSLVAGVVVAVLWWQLVDLPEATRQGGSVVVAADQLGKQVNIDGWYAVLALAVGLVSGVVLLAWRRRDPVVMVVLATLGGGLATEVAHRLGRVLGPASEVATLAQRGDGAHAMLRLQVHAPGVLWVWPAAVALGALLYLWVFADPDAE